MRESWLSRSGWDEFNQVIYVTRKVFLVPISSWYTGCSYFLYMNCGSMRAIRQRVTDDSANNSADSKSVCNTSYIWDSDVPMSVVSDCFLVT
jgi:hypothetical protein